jgi:hypothetical protein
VAVACLLAAMLTTLTAVAASGRRTPGPERVGEVSIMPWPWKGAASPVEGRTFSFRVKASCPPVLHRVEVIERPRSGEHPRGAAVVTAYLKLRASAYSCPPAIYYRTTRIRLDRLATDLVIFDGSSDPPRRVFPPPRANAG